MDGGGNQNQNGYISKNDEIFTSMFTLFCKLYILQLFILMMRNFRGQEKFLRRSENVKGNSVAHHESPYPSFTQDRLMCLLGRSLRIYQSQFLMICLCIQ